MTKLTMFVTLAVALAANIALANPNDALKAIPSAKLAGIKITGCEEKPASYSVTCRQNDKCTISITSVRVSCKGIRN